MFVFPQVESFVFCRLWTRFASDTLSLVLIHFRTTFRLERSGGEPTQMCARANIDLLYQGRDCRSSQRHSTSFQWELKPQRVYHKTFVQLDAKEKLIWGRIGCF